MTEERARALALRVARTPGYSVIEVCQAWSAMWAWQVEIAEYRAGKRVLLLHKDQFDDHFAETEQPSIGETTTIERAGAHHS